MIRMPNFIQLKKKKSRDGAKIEREFEVRIWSADILSVTSFLIKNELYACNHTCIHLMQNTSFIERKKRFFWRLNR